MRAFSTVGFAAVYNPNVIQTDRRTWSDLNGDDIYPLPYGIHLSGSWQGLPGVPVGTARQDAEYSSALNRVPDPSLNVDYNVTRAQIPSSRSPASRCRSSRLGPASSSAGTRSTCACRRRSG